MKRLMRMAFLGLVLLLETAPARADLVARYTFDDGTAVDSSGNGNDGTIVGGVTAVADAVQGNVLNYNGANGSYIRVAHSPSLDNITGAITIAMWLNTSNTSTRQIIEKGGTGGSAWYTTPWGIRLETDRRLQLHWGNVATLYSTALPLSTWAHVAMTYDSSLESNQVKFYINGVLDAQANWATMPSLNTYDLFIGTDFYNNTSRWAYIGMIDDVQIFNTALSESEIAGVMTGQGVLNINPKSGATRVPVDQVLSWDPPAPESLEPNFVVTGYDVYFDPNETKVKSGDISVKVASAQTATSYDPLGIGDMAYLTTYFWRVDVIGKFDYSTEPNTLEGSTYSFTTMSLAPEITGQPVNQVRGADNGKLDAVLAVTVLNATHYQWYKNNSLISGATEPTLTISGVQQSDEGQYYCVASNTDSPTTVTSNTVWVEHARQTSQWAFENDYTDSIGGYDGFVADVDSTPGFDTGKIGSKALVLDGINDYLILPSAALPKAGTEMTFAFWAKNNTPTAGTVTLYAYAEAAPGNRLVNIHTPWSNNNAYLDVTNTDAGTAYDRVGVGNAVVSTGDPYWIYWVFTKDSETGVMRIYRNGVQIGQATGQTRRQYGVDHIQLGANRDANNVIGQFFNGLIDDLRIYNYAVDEVEAAYLYYDAVGEKVCINSTDPVLVKYDFNQNCKIDLGDFAELAANWMACQQVPNCVDRP
ncbi:MAG: immunoglobulin domain-containing protein [Sedimentisphaerales bacterium]|nr:immunoglobulin domain-containing protein [Sedimentisphaerales bacterium]